MMKLVNFVLTMMFIFGTFPIVSAQDIIPDEICKLVSEDNPIFVTTEKEKYDSGDIITVYGCLAENAQTKGVNIRIFDPTGERITSTTFVPSGGFFSEEFVIDEKFVLDGTYTAEVDAAGLYQATKTFVVPEFGQMTPLILVISIISIIVLSAKFNKTRKITS